jgi:serine protease Do
MIHSGRKLSALGLVLIVCLAFTPTAFTQTFDFSQLESRVADFTMIMDMKVEMSFGMQTVEQEYRQIATVVSADGLVMFNGSPLEFNTPFSSFSVKADPVRIEFTTLDGVSRYDGEYVGTDRYTKVGFARIVNADDKSFKFAEFANHSGLKVGDWVALYWLLPEFIAPPLAADVGMVSTIVDLPEYFPLTVGFGPTEILSITFDENLNAVGVLGMMPDPAATSADNAGIGHSMSQLDYPLLGIITSDRIGKLIKDPPQKGKIARGWLGITLQALTPEIQEFFEVDARGGIVVNEVVVGSPAEEAGLKIGDLVVAVNGRPIEVDTEERLPVFQRLISEMGPEAKVEFSVLRPESEMIDTLSLTAVLGQAPLAATEADEYENEELEFKVRDLVFSDYMLNNVDAETFTGVVVSELEPGGLAYIAGLQIGDVVQKIGSHEVTSVGEAELSLEALLADNTDEVVFFVWRNNKTLFVNIKTR